MSRCSCSAAILAAAWSLMGFGLPLLSGDDAKQPAAEKARSAAPAGTAKHILDSLGKPVELSFMDATLREVLKHVGKQAGLTIHIDQRGLDNVGLLADDLRISKTLRGLTLRSTLRNILRPWELTYMYHEGVLMITTPEEAETNRVTLVHDVVDLIDVPSRPGQYDYDTLIELITSTVQPESWDEVGGPGSISGYRGTIVVAQTVEVHEDITHLLAAVRKARKIAAEHRDTAPPVVSISLSPAAGADEHAAIEKALDGMAAFGFKDTPLADVADALSKDFKIPIQLDERSLDDVGLDRDSPITVDVGNVKLRQALRLALRDLALTFYVADGVLTITTPEDCEQNQITRAYPVLDMVDVGSAALGLPADHPSAGYDYDSLVQLTTTAIAVETWDEVGGPGSLAVMPAHGIFVISQTYEVQEQIKDFYTALRRTVPEKAKRVAAKEEDDGRVRLAVYTVPRYGPTDKPAAEKAEAAEKTLRQFGGLSGGGFGGPMGGGNAEPAAQGPVPTEEELLDLITNLIEPESWRQRDDVFARAVTGRLVIRHTEAVHRQIKELAVRLAIPDFAEVPNWETGQHPRLRGGFF